MNNGYDCTGDLGSLYNASRGQMMMNASMDGLMHGYQQRLNQTDVDMEIMERNARRITGSIDLIVRDGELKDPTQNLFKRNMEVNASGVRGEGPRIQEIKDEGMEEEEDGTENKDDKKPTGLWNDTPQDWCNNSLVAQQRFGHMIHQEADGRISYDSPSYGFEVDSRGRVHQVVTKDRMMISHAALNMAAGIMGHSMHYERSGIPVHAMVNANDRFY